MHETGNDVRVFKILHCQSCTLRICHMRLDRERSANSMPLAPRGTILPDPSHAPPRRYWYRHVRLSISNTTTGPPTADLRR